MAGKAGPGIQTQRQCSFLDSGSAVARARNDG